VGEGGQKGIPMVDWPCIGSNPLYPLLLLCSDGPDDVESSLPCTGLVISTVRSQVRPVNMSSALTSRAQLDVLHILSRLFFITKSTLVAVLALLVTLTRRAEAREHPTRRVGEFEVEHVENARTRGRARSTWTPLMIHTIQMSIDIKFQFIQERPTRTCTCIGDG
jgi:hypothetical protein